MLNENSQWPGDIQYGWYFVQKDDVALGGYHQVVYDISPTVSAAVVSVHIAYIAGVQLAWLTCSRLSQALRRFGHLKLP